MYGNKNLLTAQKMCFLVVFMFIFWTFFSLELAFFCENKSELKIVLWSAWKKLLTYFYDIFLLKKALCSWYLINNGIFPLFFYSPASFSFRSGFHHSIMKFLTFFVHFLISMSFVNECSRIIVIKKILNEIFLFFFFFFPCDAKSFKLFYYRQKII